MRPLHRQMLAVVALTAVTITGAALVGANGAAAADLGAYPADDEIAFEPPARRSVILDEEIYGAAAPVESRYVERHALPGPIVERHIVERPVLERRVIERRTVPPLVEPGVGHGRVVARRIVDPLGEAVVVPPQYVPPVRVQRPLRPVLEEQQIVRAVPLPVEECRVIERRYVNEFGKRVTESTRICD